MLHYFKTLSLSRGAWFLLILSCIVLEGVALYFQHGMGLVPCVMCIYERVALFGILFAGILGFLGNRYVIMRWLAILIWLGSAFKGLTLSIKHHDYQVNPSPWNQCEFKVNFPQTLPLDQWLPQVFAPGPVNCSQSQWEMFGFSMAQWLIFTFAVYLIIAVIVLISQFKRSRQRNNFMFR
ncbi:TPA: disulfide bond formation protein DsbB [Mannheimia haemolytica]